MKHIAVFNDWHFMRWVRLIIGLYFIWQAVTTRDGFSGFIGSFFLLQAITNTGCCGSGGCHIPIKKSVENKEAEDIDYTIIKS
ncbi:MAG: hypothetical protein WBO36_13340 [Saprospiraceae bacterium]